MPVLAPPRGPEGRLASTPRHGLTLVELLVTLGLLALLAAILSPVAAAAGERADQADCTAHLRQLGQAVTLYLQDYDQHRPSYLHQLSPTYVSEAAVFTCPSDLWLDQGGWAWSAWGQYSTPREPWPFPVSYGYFWHLAPTDTRPGSDWQRVQRTSELAGHTVCVLHGQRGQPLKRDAAPMFAGLVLRAGFNGEVVRRQITYPPGQGGFHALRLQVD
jgi:prepilin-type N-terminal cleavage/methylation domain-containing protein